MNQNILTPSSPTRLFLVGVWLAIVTIIVLAGVSASTASENELTMGVVIKGPVEVALRDLPRYVRVVALEDNRGQAVTLEDRVELKGGYRLEVAFHKDDELEAFHFSKPYNATLSAPIYLGKTVEINRVSAQSLDGQMALVTIPEGDPVLAVEGGEMLVCISRDCRFLDGAVTLTFLGEEMTAYAPRPIGIKPIRKQSFELMGRWVSAGEDVRIRVPIPNLDKDNSRLAVGFWTDHNKAQMENEVYQADITAVEPDKGGGGLYIVQARVPYLSDIPNVLPGWQSPMPLSVKMTVAVDSGNGRIMAETFDMRFTRRGWGVAAGLVFVCVMLLLIMIMTRNFNPFKEGSDRYTKWKDTYKTRRLVRFFFSPLDIAVSPFGTYSISVTQALFWTFIVAFSCVYVYMLKAAFIVISPQILILLGITGGTALASRINSTSRDVVPKELLIDFQRSDIPRLRDMISIAGQLNIYKFQMMVFTIITGLIVVVELIKASNFPEIPDTLIMLMGLSNTLYLGNEVTVEPVHGVREKVKAYKEEQDPDKKTAIGEEIKRMLSQY